MVRGGELWKECKNKRKGPSRQEGALDRTLSSKAHGLEPTMCPPSGLSLSTGSGGNDFSWPVGQSFPSLSSSAGWGHAMLPVPKASSSEAGGRADLGALKKMGVPYLWGDKG